MFLCEATRFYLAILFQKTMFSATLTVKHESTGQSYQLKVSSLGSVLELVEGFQGIIEEEYNMLFPEIPSLFYGGKEDEEDSVGIPSCPIPLEVMEYQEDPVQVSEVNDGSLPPTLSPPPKKVKCPECPMLDSTTNLARHVREIHHPDPGAKIHCDAPCPYSAPEGRYDVLPRRKESKNSWLRFT